MSANFASYLSPIPVSISTVSLPVRTSRQFRPMRTRLRASAAAFFSHITLGTTPKIWPPSRANVPSEIRARSKQPSFIGRDHSGGRKQPSLTIGPRGRYAGLLLFHQLDQDARRARGVQEGDALVSRPSAGFPADQADSLGFKLGERLLELRHSKR